MVLYQVHRYIHKNLLLRSTKGQNRNRDGEVPLVATTAGSSAAGVELPTDDCRQPAGITDENSFFYFFMAGDHFFGKKNFF
jgi:hypothetical protein